MPPPPDAAAATPFEAISADGARLAGDLRGRGPLVVLVGGALQHRGSDRVLPALAGLLAPRFAVASYDRRGRGASGDGAAYAPAREMDDLAAVAAEAARLAGQGPPVALLGLSSGAVLALQAAARAPGLASRLVLWEPPLDPHAASRAPGDAADRAARAHGAPGRLGRARGTVGLSLRGLRALARDPFGLPAARESLRRDWLLVGEALAGGDLPATWRGLRAPVLVLDGAASWPWVRPAADWLAATLPDARRLTLPGLAHEPEPAALTAAAGPFLAP